MKLALKTTFSLLTITITIILYGGATDKMNAGKLDLPKTVGVWALLTRRIFLNT
jgi:hypothetical protein